MLYLEVQRHGINDIHKITAVIRHAYEDCSQIKGWDTDSIMHDVGDSYDYCEMDGRQIAIETCRCARRDCRVGLPQ